MPLVAAVLALTAPHAAAAAPPRGSYCSPSGDLCFGVKRRRGAFFLEITTVERYFSRYRLCVTAPGGSRGCRTFPIRRRGRFYGSSVRWNTSFPRLGAGLYRVTWSLTGRPLGPALSFRVAG